MQWNPQGQPGGFSSDVGVLSSKVQRVKLPRPLNKVNMSGSVSNKNFDKMYAKDYTEPPQSYAKDNARSSTFEG
jgi:hypothetical protein